MHDGVLRSGTKIAGLASRRRSHNRRMDEPNFATPEEAALDGYTPVVQARAVRHCVRGNEIGDEDAPGLPRQGGGSSGHQAQQRNRAGFVEVLVPVPALR